MKDMFGRELAIGNYVSGLFPFNETPTIFKVGGFLPKKVRLRPISNATVEFLKFPHDLIVVCPIAVQQVSTRPPEDALGQLLEVGDYVFGAGGSDVDPIIFKIASFVPLKAIVKKVFGNHYYSADNNTRYLTDLIKVNPALITMHCLSKENV